MKRYDMVGDYADVEMVEMTEGDYVLFDDMADVIKDAERYLKARDGLRWFLSPDKAMIFAEVDAHYDAAMQPCARRRTCS